MTKCVLLTRTVSGLLASKAYNCDNLKKQNKTKTKKNCLNIITNYLIIINNYLKRFLRNNCLLTLGINCSQASKAHDYVHIIIVNVHT